MDETAHAPEPGAQRREEAEQASITFDLEGKRYTIWPGEVSSSLAREFRASAGMSFRAAMLVMQDDPDIDLLRPLVFLARRQASEQIVIDDVDDFTYQQSASLAFVDTDTAGGDEDLPET